MKKCGSELFKLLLAVNLIAGLLFMPVLIQAADPVAVKPAQTTAGRIGAGTEYDGIALRKDAETAASKTLIAKVAVDENSIIQPVNTLLFGYNHDGPSDNNVLFKDNKINDSVVDLCKGIPMPLNRIQTFGYFSACNWKKCIGPFDQRQPVKMIDWQKLEKKAYGPVEAIDFCRRVDPNAKFTWNVNIKTDSPEDSADLVEFLTGDGTKPRGTTNWAKRRIELGLPVPAQVLIWEMENEVDWANPPGRMNVNDYIEKSRKHLEAIRSVDPNAKIALHAATAPWAYKQRFNEDWRDWHRTILKQMGSQIDYIAFHPYYSGHAIAYIEDYLNIIHNDIAASSNPKIKIFISEHATWPLDINKKETWYKVQTLSAALSVSHFLSVLLAREDIGAATFHCFTHGGGLWGLLDVDKKSKERFKTAFADLFTILNQGLGVNVVRTTVSGDNIPMKGKGEKTYFIVTAMTTKDGLNLLMVNREPAASREINFTFINKYTLIKETTFTAPTMDTYNTGTVKNNFVTEKTVNVENFKTYLMPPKSVVILTLRKR